MNKLRDVSTLLVVVAAFATSLHLLRQAVGLTSPWFAITLMFSFLGVLAFARTLFVLQLPRVIREVRPREIYGSVYTRMGVPAFGLLLRRTPLRLLQPLVYLDRFPGDPATVKTQIEGAEAAHFWAAVLISPYILYACIQNWWSVVLGVMVVQIAINLYPVLHLRRARGRLERVLKKKMKNQESLMARD